MPKLLTTILPFALIAVFMTGPLPSAYAAMPNTPECVKAYNTLSKGGSARDAQKLVKHDCKVMYNQKWLLGKGKNHKLCPQAWAKLVEKKMIPAVQELVSRNCAVMYKRGWRNP